MIAAKKEWCMICRTEHIDDMHINKFAELKANELFNECINFFPNLQIELAYDLMILRINDCIKIHYHLDGDACGIGNSFKFWNEVKIEAEKIKYKYKKQ